MYSHEVYLQAQFSHEFVAPDLALDVDCELRPYGEIYQRKLLVHFCRHA